MVNAPKLVLDYLEAQPTLTALTGSRIWAERVVPPVGYQPWQGGAIAFRTRGGSVDYANLLYPSMQFKCYGADEAEANAVYRALFDVLHEPSVARPFRQALNESLGQMLDEPDTGWLFVLTFFRFIF